MGYWRLDRQPLERGHGAGGDRQGIERGGGRAHTIIIYSNQTVGISSMISVHSQGEVASNQAIHPVNGPLGPT
jgi:hypothetical protein